MVMCPAGRARCARAATSWLVYWLRQGASGGPPVGRRKIFFGKTGYTRHEVTALRVGGPSGRTEDYQNEISFLRNAGVCCADAGSSDCSRPRGCAGGDATGSCGGSWAGGECASGERDGDEAWLVGGATGEDQEQRGVQGASGEDRAGCDSCGRVWTDYSAVDAGTASVWKHQSAWLAAAQVSRGCADSMGSGLR